ncbi:Uncharacterised protein [Vibrio cholerae]|nr:Uncharacterised protein [Vibrio cholerae]CSI54222.1 Uncharacterised protein [Vibrio cholerae]
MEIPHQQRRIPVVATVSGTPFLDELSIFTITDSRI